MAYGILLLITLLVEGVVIFLFGLRTIRDHVRIVLVNCITHPLFFASLLFLGVLGWRGVPDIRVIIGALEVIIVTGEFFLLSWLYPKKRRFFLLSMDIAMNTASALAGFITFF